MRSPVSYTHLKLRELHVKQSLDVIKTPFQPAKDQRSITHTEGADLEHLEDVYKRQVSCLAKIQVLQREQKLPEQRKKQVFLLERLF